MLVMVACSGPNVEAERGSVGFLGGVAADEPHAAQVGRNILAIGGNAADAAVAVYFMMSVTLPSHASLGGGGVCVVHDQLTKVTESLEFLARPTLSVPAGADRPSAIPGNPRGFYALHSKYGALHWGQVISPAEEWARFGYSVSRAFANDVHEVEAHLLTDDAMRQIFSANEGGGLVKEGEYLQQVDLAATLGRMRVQGPGEFYLGETAQKLVAAVAKAGGSLSREDLRDYIPNWAATIPLQYGNLTMHFAPPPAAGGAVAAQIWSMLAEGDRFIDADETTRNHLIAEAAMLAYGDRTQWMRPDGTSLVPAADLVGGSRLERLGAALRLDWHSPAVSLQSVPVERPENSSAATFVVVDRDGSAVSCGLTLNNLFGTGRVAPETGIVLAARPDANGRGASSLGPALAVNEFTNRFYLAIAASGGATAPTVLAGVGLEAMAPGRPLEDALSRPRVYHGGAPDLLYYEEGVGRDVLDRLLALGHRIAPSEKLGRINAVVCRGGLPSKFDICSIETDGRGAGLAVSTPR
jgi:gamma-glutamyltranspeptidase/glutathione hydrolase